MLHEARLQLPKQADLRLGGFERKIERGGEKLVELVARQRRVVQIRESGALFLELLDEELPAIRQKMRYLER